MSPSEASGSGPAGRSELSELKRRLRSKYLGKYGIHALGIRSSEDAICVYLSPGADDQESGLRLLRNDVAPHGLVVVQEEAPRIT